MGFSIFQQMMGQMALNYGEVMARLLELIYLKTSTLELVTAGLPILISFQGHLYFAADNGTQGEELWRTDGTPAGTILFKDINIGPGDSEPYYPRSFWK